MLNLFSSRGEQEKSDVAEILSCSNFHVEFDSYALKSWSPSKSTQACLWAFGVTEDATIEDIVNDAATMVQRVDNMFDPSTAMTFGCDMDTYEYHAVDNDDEGMDSRLLLGMNSVDCTSELPRIYRDFVSRILSTGGAGINELAISPAPWYSDIDNTRAVSVVFNQPNEQLWRRLRSAWSKKWTLCKAPYGVAGRPIYSAVPAGADGETDVDAIIEKIEAFGRNRAAKKDLQALSLAYRDLQWLWWTKGTFDVVPTVIISE